MAIDLETGRSSVIASTNVGEGRDLDDLEYIALDSGSNQIYITEGSSVSVVDIATGDRNDIVSIREGGGNARAFVVDNENDRVLVTLNDAVVNVDISTATSTVLSQAGVRGDGAGPSIIYGMALDSINDRVIVSGFEGVFSVDLATGNRSVIDG